MQTRPSGEDWKQKFLESLKLICALAQGRRSLGAVQKGWMKGNLQQSSMLMSREKCGKGVSSVQGRGGRALCQNANGSSVWCHQHWFNSLSLHHNCPYPKFFVEIFKDYLCSGQREPKAVTKWEVCGKMPIGAESDAHPQPPPQLSTPNTASCSVSCWNQNPLPAILFGKYILFGNVRLLLLTTFQGPCSCYIDESKGLKHVFYQER